MKATTLVLAAAMAAGTRAYAQEADCNVNGIPDATEIAQGLVDDCNGNGIPDVCEYAGVTLEAEQSGFGNGSPLIATFSEVEVATSDVRVTVEMRADLDGVTEFVRVMVGDSLVAILWLMDGLACPGMPQSATLVVSADIFNHAIVAGELAVSLQPSGAVSPKECAESFATYSCAYVSAAAIPDCLGNGVWDGCDIASEPAIDCDANGQIDACELDYEPGLDCDSNGLLDSCELAADSLLDCDANGRLDSCDIASAQYLDCDHDGHLDSCQIAVNPTLDCSMNGVLNSCELLLGGTYLDYDCDDDGQNDACQIDADPTVDKNADGLLDGCQYARGDFDLDRMVGGSDLAVLLSLWGEVDLPFGDLTGDGVIDGADLASLLGNWGSYGGPWGAVLDVEPDPSVITDPEWRERIIATGLPWRVRDNASRIEMLLVPPGSFIMGCSPSSGHGCSASELPVREVALTQPFYLGRYEVTQGQWTAIMNYNPSVFWERPDSENHPVERVSWDAIQPFLGTTNLRLPSEAEWEYACRAGTSAAYNLPPVGTDDESVLDEVAWYNQNWTTTVGGRRANALGLHDMHGNVFEWCHDWFSEDYYAVGSDVDPAGPLTGELRVLRGGGWSAGWADGCRASFRGASSPNSGDGYYYSVGFRVARTP